MESVSGGPGGEERLLAGAGPEGLKRLLKTSMRASDKTRQTRQHLKAEHVQESLLEPLYEHSDRCRSSGFPTPYHSANLAHKELKRQIS